MTDLIAQLEALIQDKQRSAWDCANCGFEANLVEAVSNALRTAERERDEARDQRDYWRGRDKAGLEIEAELRADITRGIEQEQHLTTKLGIATRRAEAAESALSARSREVERLRADSDRLEWLMSRGARVVWHGKDSEFCSVWLPGTWDGDPGRQVTGLHVEAREAIDEAGRALLKALESGQ